MSLTDILQFKQEPESIERMRWYRKWVRKIADSDVSDKLIREEIENMIDNFTTSTQQMTSDRNFNKVTLWLTLPIQIVRSIVTLNPDGLVNPALKIRELYAPGIVKELKLEGREISYFVQS
jgi:hypothetical protein